MKTIFTIFFLGFNIFSYAQCSNNLDKESRSYRLAMLSRANADKVLQIFDSINAPKLVYSIEDEHYIVIIKNDDNFNNYYVHMDSISRKLEVRLLESIKGEQALLLKAFDLKKYNTDFIMDSRNILSAKKYFVVKDIKGQRHGECSVLSLPFVHIDEELNLYLAKRLAEIIY